MNALKDIILIMKDVGRITGDAVKVQLDQAADVYRDILMKVLTWLVVVLTALILAMGGLAMISWGVYLALSLVAGPAISALLVGVMLFLIAAIFFLIARGMLKE